MTVGALIDQLDRIVRTKLNPGIKTVQVDGAGDFSFLHEVHRKILIEK